MLRFSGGCSEQEKGECDLEILPESDQQKLLAASTAGESILKMGERSIDFNTMV